MVRKIGLAICGIVAAAAFAAPAVAGDLVRIETTPSYGATVTVEQGVRIFRPLPAPSRIIINPGGKTPLSLSFFDVQTNDAGHGHAGHQLGDGDQQGFGGAASALRYGVYGSRLRPRKRRRIAGDSGARRRMPTIRKGLRPAR